MYKIQVAGSLSLKWFDLEKYFNLNEIAANQSLEILKNQAGDFFRKVKIS